MNKILCLCIVFILSYVSLAQQPDNYVVIEQPTNVRSAPQNYWYYSRYIVRGVVSDVNLAVTGRNFEGNQICTGIWEHDRILWLQVDLYGIEGWVKFCENDFVGDLSSVPVTTALNPEYHACFDVGSMLDRLGDEPDVPNIIATTKGVAINLREQPNITSERIDILRSKEVYAIGRTSDNVWLKVHYNSVPAICGWRMLGVDRVDLDGWVAVFLLDLPDGWQDMIPVFES